MGDMIYASAIGRSVCRAYPVTQLMEYYATEQVEYSISRSDFLEICNRFFDPSGYWWSSKSVKGYIEDMIEGLTDLAEFIVSQTGKYPTYQYYDEDSVYIVY